MHEIKIKHYGKLQTAVKLSLQIYESTGVFDKLNIFSEIDNFFDLVDVSRLACALKVKLETVQQKRDEWLALQIDVVDTVKNRINQNFGEPRTTPSIKEENQLYTAIMNEIIRENFARHQDVRCDFDKYFKNVPPEKDAVYKILQQIKVEINDIEKNKSAKAEDVINAIIDLKDELKK